MSVLPFLRGMGPMLTRPVVPGSASYATPGTYTLLIPYYNSLVVDVRGAGGGGGGAASNANRTPTNGSPGAGGNLSYFLANGIIQVIGYGGGAGSAALWVGSGIGQNGTPGPHGTAVNGDSNITGGGEAGGQYGYGVTGHTGYTVSNGGLGGNGGRAVRTFYNDYIPPMQNVTIVVGAGGAPGANAPMQTTYQNPGAGANGGVYISWS